MKWVLGISLVISGCFYSGERGGVVMMKRGIRNIKVGDTEITARILKDSISRNAQSSSVLYFNVRIERTGESSFDKDKTLYANFDMQKDFVLAVGRDSLPSIFCQKIENGRSRSYEYIVAFEANERKITDLTLVYNDKIFGAGVVGFVYQLDDINN